MQLNLPVELAGLTMRNPTMLAAGILGMTGSSLRMVWEAGAGAVVSKSVGVIPREGYSNPTVVDTGCGVLNAMGLPNPGIVEYEGEIHVARARGDIVIVGSVYGDAPDQYAEVAKRFQDVGVNAVELNVSCPHVASLGMEVGQDPVLLEAVVKAVKGAVTVPVFTKLTPNTGNIRELARAAVQAGGDGIVAINTLRAMAIDVETGRPILTNKIGGLSGPAIKPVAVRCVYEISKTVDVPVIGCGGVTNWRDAMEFFLAGASAIQIGTAVAYRGLGIFEDIGRGIRAYLAKKGYASMGDVIGRSHKC
jgi:dihydroorotate dehydrogenase (NAD+) catalytic subunit